METLPREDVRSYVRRIYIECVNPLEFVQTLLSNSVLIPYYLRHSSWFRNKSDRSDTIANRAAAILSFF